MDIISVHVNDIRRYIFNPYGSKGQARFYHCASQDHGAIHALSPLAEESTSNQHRADQHRAWPQFFLAPVFSCELGV